MSSQIKYANESSTTVTFALYNGYENHSETHSVRHGKDKQKTLENSDLRIITVWTDENDLFPNAANPAMATYQFSDDKNYTLTFAANGTLNVSEGISAS